jgi:hypothetical protein
MAKAIKAAAVAAFVVLGAAMAVGIGFSGVAAGTTGTLFLTGAGALTAAGMAAVTFGTTLLTSVIGKMTTKGMNASSANFGTKFSNRAPLAPRQIVYGECRVGGTIVHLETTGTDNNILHMVIAVAGHEIEDITQVRLNDVNTTTTTSTISGSTVHTVTNTEFTNTENENDFGNGRLVRYSFEKGDQTAVNGFMDGESVSMGSTDKFLGVAYVYIQMVFDAEKFGGGVPQTSFVVKGKNVYDPRTGAEATTDLQRSNPALIIRDYLTDTTYGLKAKSSEINDTTNAGGFASAANTCDQQVTLADGSTTERRYTANGFTNFTANGNGVLEGVLSSMAGKMSYVNGQFTIFAGASQTPSLTITDDELLSPIAVSTNSASGDLYNSVKPIYVDASLNYTSTDAEVYQDSTFLNEDTPSGESTANYVKQMETQLPFTVTDTMAQRLGRIGLKSQRQTTTLSALVSLQFMRLQPNDWVYLTNERLNYTQKVFEVISTNMELLQTDDVPVLATRLELKEIASSVFDFASNDYTTGQAEGSDVSTGTYAVSPPSNLSLSQQNNIDGTTSKVEILANWTNNTSEKVTLTEIAYKLSTDSNYTSDFTVGKRVTRAAIPNVVVGKTYNVKIRHIDLNGVTSTYTNAVNITIAVASSAPATPTSLSVTTGRLNMLVSWTNPNSSDFRAVKVYRKTANSTPTDDTDLVDTIGGEPNKISTTLFGDQDGLTAGTTYYFWVRAVNHSDQHSAFSSSEAGNFIKAVPDGTIDTLQLAANAVTNAKIAVDAIQGDVIAAGAITNNKLLDNAVNADKINANAVTSEKINANAVTASKIAANTITATQIAADTITTQELAADAVTASKISVSTLAAITGNLGTLTAGTIDASEVTVSNLSASNISTGLLNAQLINLNGSTLSADGSGLKITTNGITVAEIGTRAVGAMGLNGGESTATFGDGRFSTNFTDLITVTFTTAEAGEYLIVSNCMVGGVFNSLTIIQTKLLIGSTQVAAYTSPTGALAIQPIVMAGKISLDANTSYTAKFQGQVSQDNTTPNVGGFNRRISALHLNKQS